MGRINLPIVVCLLAATIGAVHSDAPEPLVGASFAKDNEFPYLVSIRVKNNLHCGGAIISEFHILTAAHCIVPLLNMKRDDITIVTCTNNLYSGGTAYKVDLLMPHPEYNPDYTWRNDIGIIKVSKKIELNNCTQKIALPELPPPHNVAALIGAWGATSSPPRNVSPLLRKLLLYILSTEQCQNFFDDEIILASQICTLNQKNVGTCSGDSGSPLAYKNKVIGVVSGGIPCAHGLPDIFTNVYSFLKFIKHAMSL